MMPISNGVRHRLTRFARAQRTSARFWRRVTGDGQLDQCWLWTGGLTTGGYGVFGGSTAHRFAWRDMVGPIPAGLVLDHLCRVRHCVNPWHLDPVTPRVNVDRGILARILDGAISA